MQRERDRAREGEGDRESAWLRQRQRQGKGQRGRRERVRKRDREWQRDRTRQIHRQRERASECLSNSERVCERESIEQTKSTLEPRQSQHLNLSKYKTKEITAANLAGMWIVHTRYGTQYVATFCAPSFHFLPNSFFKNRAISFRKMVKEREKKEHVTLPAVLRN